MLADWAVILVIVATILVLLFQGASIWFAAQMPELAPSAGPIPGELPSVSVIVAARNEEEDLGNCLDDLLGQDLPGLEILVVDGASTDRTREVARARSPRVQLLEEPPLPAGWVGKNWACEVGYRSAKGAYLLFTDADVRYAPTAVRTSLEWAIKERADLATLAPRVEMKTFWERVVLPFFIQVVLTYFRAPRVNRDGSSAAMANGQYLLVRRDAYERVGGHARIRSAVLEDVRLAQEFRHAGLRLRIAWAPNLLSTRMYRDRAEMFEGLLKSVHGTEYSTARQVGFLALLVGFYWLPLGLLPVGLGVGSPLLIGLGALLWFALFGKHVVLARAVGGHAVDGLLYPVAVGFYVAVVGASIRGGLRHRPLRWKGRSYPLVEAGSDPSSGNG